MIVPTVSQLNFKPKNPFIDDWNPYYVLADGTIAVESATSFNFYTPEGKSMDRFITQKMVDEVVAQSESCEHFKLKQDKNGYYYWEG